MEKFYFFNSFLDTARAIEDEKLRLEYMMAVAEYWLEGKESDNPIIRALMVQTKFVLDRSKWMSGQKSEKMKGNKNAVKTWEKQWKQTKTEWNREEQKKQEEEVEEEIEDINNLSNDKLDNEVVQYGDEGINKFCSKIREVYEKHWLSIDLSNRKYAGQRIRKWELVKAKKEWLDSHWYQDVEQFVNDIISRAKTIKYWNWLSKISDLYGLWKHKDEIMNLTHKAIEPWTLEHFNWFCENYVWKQIFHDLDGDKLYTKAMYFNYLMNEHWWERSKAREARDKMLGR